MDLSERKATAVPRQRSLEAMAGHGPRRSEPFGSGAATDLGRGPGGRTAVLSLSERLFCLRGASSAMGQCGLRSCGCDEPEASDLKEASAPRTLRLAILRHGERADQANPKMWRPGALSLRFFLANTIKTTSF